VSVATPVDQTVSVPPDDPEENGPHHPGPQPGSFVSHDEDEYEGYDEEVRRIQALFADPVFRDRQRQRDAAAPLRPVGSSSANGSIGRAMALGMANVFDPDRVKEDVMIVAEKGQGDPDVPDTEIDPDDPRETRIIYRSR
jgi:hypothetical protein